MKLKDLLDNISTQPIPEEFQELDITSICSDSRKTQKGSLFVALDGPNIHGSQFIKDAISRGAKVIVQETYLRNKEEYPGTLFLEASDTHWFLKEMLVRFHDDPSRKVKVIGITGTNGKTTCTYFLESVFHHIGKACGVIGTVNHRFGQKVFPAKNTTPGIVDNYDYLSQMVDAKVDYCIMEVSSHALVQKRVNGINFRVGLFTNLSSDHLDYHGNCKEYFEAKSLLFRGLANDAHAVINIDDPYGPEILRLSKTGVTTYAIQNRADIMAKDVQMNLSESNFTLVTPAGEMNIRTHLVGQHNIYNILAAVGVCLSENVLPVQIKEGIEQMRSVPGRMERIDQGQPFYVFTDYAHTEDALKNVLSSVRNVTKRRVILVFGCGGDRDQSKRPKMGKVANDLADISILTNDNPRGEDPEVIIEQIAKGFTNKDYKIIPDRREAIAEGLRLAQEGDVVLIAGKGHEDYQIFRDKILNFNEREILKELLNATNPQSKLKT